MAKIVKQKGPATPKAISCGPKSSPTKPKTRACRPKTESAKLAIAKGGSGKFSEGVLAKSKPLDLESLKGEVEKAITEFTQLVQKIGLKADIILDVAVHIQPRDKNTD